VSAGGFRTGAPGPVSLFGRQPAACAACTACRGTAGPCAAAASAPPVWPAGSHTALVVSSKQLRPASATSTDAHKGRRDAACSVPHRQHQYRGGQPSSLRLHQALRGCRQRLSCPRSLQLPASQPLQRPPGRHRWSMAMLLQRSPIPKLRLRSCRSAVLQPLTPQRLARRRACLTGNMQRARRCSW